MSSPSPGTYSQAAGRGARNKAFLAIWLSIFVGTLGIGMVSPLLPVFAKDMGASGLWLGLAFSGFAITEMPLMPFTGRLSDRVGRKLFLALGMLVYTAVGTGFIWAPNYQAIVVLRMISGIGAAMVFPIAFAYVGDLSDPGHEGRYMGLFNVAFLFGWGAGPVLGGVTKDKWGMDAPFISMAVLSGVACVFMFLLLPSDKSPGKGRFREEKRTPMARLLQDKVMRAVVTLQFVWGLSYGAVYSFLAIFMTSNLSTSVAAVGIVMSTRSLLNGVMAYPFGYLADRFSRARLVTLGVLASAAGVSLVPWMGSFALLLALFIGVALCESVSTPAINAMTVESGRDLGMGSVMGLSTMAMAAGMVTGSMAGGLVQDLLHIDYVFWFASLSGVFGAVLFNVFIGQGSRQRERLRLPGKTSGR